MAFQIVVSGNFSEIVEILVVPRELNKMNISAKRLTCLKISNMIS